MEREFQWEREGEIAAVANRRIRQSLVDYLTEPWGELPTGAAEASTEVKGTPSAPSTKPPRLYKFPSIIFFKISYLMLY